MKKWISFPRVEGNASRQAHCDLPDHTFEREMSKEGFFGPSAQLYHRHPPTSWTAIDGPLLPRAFDTSQLQRRVAHPWDAPVLLSNAHTRICVWNSSGSMRSLARNADGDQLLFLHRGQAELFCDYGHMNLGEGDYLVLPRGTTWRLQHEKDLVVLMIEASGNAFGLPDKGLLGHHAIFDPAMLDTPVIDDSYRAQQNDDPHQVVVKRHNRLTTIQYPFNPLDTVGWHGDLAPVRINWRDIRPVMSHRYHVPPSGHTTFVADRFVVCTFCPRPIESDPGALKVPFFHNNDDYDEVIFYHSGRFFSRDNIHPGMMTLHPAGLTHGPHPKALQTGLNAQRKETDEVAVMVDTRDPLEITPDAEAIEQKEYVNSWSGGDV
jgi:homogentisate 1,2-dioxygenase